MDEEDESWMEDEEAEDEEDEAQPYDRTDWGSALLARIDASLPPRPPLLEFEHIVMQGPLPRGHPLPQLPIPRAPRQGPPHPLAPIVKEVEGELPLHTPVKLTNTFRNPSATLLTQVHETANIFYRTFRQAGDVPSVVDEGLRKWRAEGRTVTADIIETLQRAEDRRLVEADIDFATFESAVATLTDSLHANCTDAIHRPGSQPSAPPRQKRKLNGRQKAKGKGKDKDL
eukprot:GHVU01169469.1.p2 GENE.GHVU01169469.1~~GHVU01169469.1.p2  ORF type:complete len:229 (+),score=35.94 GHVU01169469.1:3-689(+)